MMFRMMNKKLVTVLKTLGLTAKHATIYSTLLSQPKATPLTLARLTKLNRSSIYRYLTELQKAGLAEEILESHRTVFQATSPENLQLLVTQQEAKMETLKQTVPLLIKELESGHTNVPQGTQVNYYQGKEGLRQMLWKMVKSGKDYAGLGYEDWNTSVGKAFAEKLRNEHVKSGAKSREILNETDDSYQYTQLGKEYEIGYSHRSISSKILEIKHDTYIYGDVFAFYYHYQGELFGVEIHNTEIAKTEKQIFEILWKSATPVKK